MTVQEQKIPQDSVLTEIVSRLVRAFQPDRIYLFGSRARGEDRADSDYDLLLVIPFSSLPKYKREQAAFRVLCGVGASKDVIVLTREEFESQLSVITSLSATVEREGRLVYAG